MSVEEEIYLSDDGGNVPRKLTDDFENNFDSEEMLEDKWVFHKPSDHLGTVLQSGVVRPLSPTLKVHSPEFPGVAMLYEGFDDMREWKNTIEFVRFFSKKGNMFNSRHHWNMRTKFLEVRLRCMDKIIEDPSRAHREPVGGFFVRVPLAGQKTKEEEERKTAVACEKIVRKQQKMDEHCYVEQQHCATKELRDNKERKRCVNNTQKQLGITAEGENMIEIKNYPRHGMHKHRDNVEHNSINVKLSSARKNSTSMSNTRMNYKGKPRKIDIWIPNQNNYIEDSSMCMLESSYSFNNEHVLSASSPEVTLPMLREQRRLQKENIHENCREDEKLKRESLQKGINLETQRETLCAIPGTSAEYVHFPPSNDRLQDLRVIGKSWQVNSSSTTELFDSVDKHSSHSKKDSETVSSTKGLSSESVTLSCKVKDELVLEEISDKDFVSDVVLPSSCKLEHTSVTGAVIEAKFSRKDVSEILVKENTVERPRQETLSRLQRLRRRIRNLFCCFARTNQVTPVNI